RFEPSAARRLPRRSHVQRSRGGRRRSPAESICTQAARRAPAGAPGPAHRLRAAVRSKIPRQPVLMRTVALFADRWILPGLHVTVASLLDHAVDSEPLRVVVFGEGLSRRDKELLGQTVSRRLGRHTFDVREFVMPETSRLKSLRGNYTTYGRLYLPELLPDADSCVYLDCDLIVTCQIDPLLARASSDCLIHADGTGWRADSIDNRSFERLGLDMSKPYFNGGVLALNLELWRKQHVGEHCLEFARSHRELLTSADQM